MDLLLSLIFTFAGFGLIVLYVFSFVLLWKDEKFNDLVKLAGTILFLTIAPTSWIYLIYRMFRS